MLNAFDQRELLSTHNRKLQAEVCRLLESVHIDYSVRVVGRSGSPSGPAAAGPDTGAPGQIPEPVCKYSVFVKKDEYDRARRVLHDSGPAEPAKP